MTTKIGIISAINAKVGSLYSAYRIGLTHDTADRKRHWKEVEKQDVTYWAQWQADSLSDAQDIEANFINKGMKGGTGGNLSARYITYVYVF
jgi:hypothetical protein